jgi:hypothetical protein
MKPITLPPKHVALRRMRKQWKARRISAQRHTGTAMYCDKQTDAMCIIGAAMTQRQRDQIAKVPANFRGFECLHYDGFFILSDREDEQWYREMQSLHDEVVTATEVDASFRIAESLLTYEMEGCA